MRPLPPRVSDWLHNPLPKCGLLMGVAAGLGEGQGERGQRACVTRGQAGTGSASGAENRCKQ